MGSSIILDCPKLHLPLIIRLALEKSKEKMELTRGIRDDMIEKNRQ
jgi:hypothetical protein